MVAPRRGLKQHARVQPRSRGFCLLQTLAERAGTHIIADSAKREGPRAPLCSRVGENLRRRVFLKWTSLDSRLIPSRRFFFFQPPLSFFLLPLTSSSFSPFFSKKNKTHNSQTSSRECPTCGGSGTVTCTCTRWSDSAADSSGCGSCGGSRRSSCHHCGGGGRAVPLARRVHVERSPGPYDRR